MDVWFQVEAPFRLPAAQPPVFSREGEYGYSGKSRPYGRYQVKTPPDLIHVPLFVPNVPWVAGVLLQDVMSCPRQKAREGFVVAVESLATVPIAEETTEAAPVHGRECVPD